MTKPSIARLRARGVRIEKDLRNEKLNYKIREAQLMKVPYMLIIGEREKEEGTVTVRQKDGTNLPAMTPDAFVDLVVDECRRGIA
jgi:threonyl-tRNA synthetase